jgi:hypothetical protein
MRLSHRGGKARARLNCETLEDRTTPALAFALSGANLLAFDTASPTITQTTAISGVTAGETLVGIDFRPQNGHLYALGVTSAGSGTLYDVSIRTGLATVVGAAGGVTPTAPMPDPSLATSGFAFDFNPLVDRLRVLTSAGQSFAVDPNTGLVVANAPTLNGGTTTADGTAYTNNQPNVTATTLYTIDSASDTLYLQNPATSLTTAVGTGIGFDFNRLNGFDIPAGVNATTTGAPVTTGSGFAVLTVGGTTGLYSIDLVTGAGTLVGNVGTGTSVISGFAVQSDLGGFPAIALDAAGTNLIRFNTATPGTTTTQALGVASLAAGEVLVGIDFRPQTGQLYGLAVNAVANTATLYLIDPQTGALSPVGTQGQIAFTTNGTTPVDFPDPVTAGYGIDFNPTVDRIRVTTSTGLNFRVNPNNGAPVDGDLGGPAGSVTGINPDGNINGLPGGSTGVSAVAYTNSFGQALPGPATTLYTLDAASNMLFIQNPPNAGGQANAVTVTFGGSVLDFTDVSGFDIPGARVATSNAVATGFGYAALTVGGVTSTYRIDLTTGVATNLGAIGTGAVPLAGFTLADAPAGTVAFLSATNMASETGTTAAVVLTRTGGTNGPLTVTVNVTGGSAGAGTDFAAGPFTVTIPDGVATTTLNIPLTNDTIVEGAETVTLSLSNPTAGALGTQTTTTLTINDDDIVQNVGALFGTNNAVIVMGSDGAIRNAFFPYGASFSGGIRVAKGDVNGDGVTDIITVPAVGAPQVRVFNGVTGAIMTDFVAWPVAIFGPASLASGDVNNDGFDDIILGTATNFGAFGVFNGQTGTLVTAAAPFGLIPIGINVASGDMNNDGFDDIIVGTSSAIGGVAVVSGQDLSLLKVFVPTGSLPIGVTVAVGDVNNDGFADIVVGTTGLVPAAAAFDGQNLSLLRLLAPYGPGSFGLNVALSDINNDGRPELFLGPTSGSSPVLIFNGTDFSLLASLPGSAGGVFVG